MGKGKKSKKQPKQEEKGAEGGVAETPSSSVVVEEKALEERPPKGAWKKDKEKAKQKGAPKQQKEKEKDLSLSMESVTLTSGRTEKIVSKDVVAIPVTITPKEVGFPQRDSITASNFFKTELIWTNYLDMDLTKLPDTIYQYSISFEPDRPKKFVFPAFNALIRNFLPMLLNKVAFDGVKIFYSMIKIDDNDFAPLEIESPDRTGKPRTIKMSVKFAAEIDMMPIKANDSNRSTPAIQALDIVLKSAFDRSDLTRYKSSVFVPPKDAKMDLGDNYELLIGLFQSFIMGSRPLLNVDVSHKAFPSHCDNLPKLYENYASNANKNFGDILKGLNLVYTCPFNKEKKTFKFTAMCKPPNQLEFTDSDNKVSTVEAYFNSKGVTLKYPNYPCIHVGPMDKTIYIPMEFLSIPAGQALNRPAPEACKPQMIKFAVGSTTERKTKIMNLLKEIDYSKVATIKQFGIEIKKDFISVNAHILIPPKLQYNNIIITIQKPGEWRINQEKFLLPHKPIEGPPTKWGIVVLDQRANSGKVAEFGKNIADRAKDFGLNFGIYDQDNEYWSQKNDNLDNILLSFKEENFKYIFVITSGTKDQRSYVKDAERRVGILTGCIKSFTIFKKHNDASTLTNIMNKVNQKLGGTNYKIIDETCITKRPFMVMGADVAHPSAGENKPSAVGVVASYDKGAARYNSTWRLQINRKKNKQIQEIIEKFDEMVEEHLRCFKNVHKILPKHILYYRDGVSEGQFSHVLETELSAIKKACEKMGNPNIDVTVIIVQKRHHTRLFPDPEKHKNDRYQNVTPGTVVDSVIVNPHAWQYFMVPHISIQGVAKPSKYVVLHDDAKLSNKDLQVFTFNLCHLYARCTRSVSYPAPTYYAHLMAARAGDYIYNNKNINMVKLDHEKYMDKLNQENDKLHAEMTNSKLSKEYPMYFI